MTTKTICGPKCRCQKCYEMHGCGPMVTNKMNPITTAERLFLLSLELSEEWKTRAEKAEFEVKRLTDRMKDAEDLIQRGQAGWEKEREFHRKTSENAGREISN